MSSASSGAMNKSGGGSKHQRQCTGGCIDDTPGQVANNNLSARMMMAVPHRLDSVGGAEHRGKDNTKRGS